MTLFLRYWPYLAAAAVLYSAGIWSCHALDRPRYAKLQSEYSAYQITVAHQEAAAQEAARKALDEQIAARNLTEENNARVIQDLQAKADHAIADRDFAARLLAAARQTPVPASGQLPQADNRSPADAAPASGGDQSLAQLLGDAAGECRDAINQLTSLQAELASQL